MRQRQQQRMHLKQPSSRQLDLVSCAHAHHRSCDIHYARIYIYIYILHNTCSNTNKQETKSELRCVCVCVRIYIASESPLSAAVIHYDASFGACIVPPEFGLFGWVWRRNQQKPARTARFSSNGATLEFYKPLRHHVL